jgi:hypothetical protein
VGEVELRDVSFADIPATSIAQGTIHTPGLVPVAFELDDDPSSLAMRQTCPVQACWSARHRGSPGVCRGGWNPTGCCQEGCLAIIAFSCSSNLPPKLQVRSSDLFPGGPLTVRNNGVGLLADGDGTLTILSDASMPSSIVDNGTDVDLKFGTPAPSMATRSAPSPMMQRS